MQQTVRIAVTGPSGDTGHGIVRGLRECVFPLFVIGLDFRQHYGGEKYCDICLRMPQVADIGYVTILKEVLRAYRVKYLLSGIDSEIAVLAEHAEGILAETGCQVLVPDKELVKTCSDKLLTADWLRDLGIRVPGTWRGDCFCQHQQGLDVCVFPLVIKPRRGHSSIGVQIIRDRDEFEAIRASLTEHICVQEFLPGPEYTCGLLYDATGRLCDWLVTRRELAGGRTMVAEVCHDPVIDDFIRHFGKTVSARGVINLQLRMNADGLPSIFEINPRFSGSTLMRLAAGYNDVQRLLESSSGGKPITRHEVSVVRVIREWSCQVQSLQNSYDPALARVKTVVFDCGGTLLRQNPSSEALCLSVLRELGVTIPLISIEEAYRVADAILKRRSSQERNAPDRREFFRQFNAQLVNCLGIGSLAEEFDARLFRLCSGIRRQWEPMPGAVAALEQLSKTFDLCVLANWDKNLAEVLERAQLDRFFRVIFDSATAGCEKPQPGIFDQFGKLAMISPAEAAYVGNEYEADIVGSRAAGFHPILLDLQHRYSAGVDCRWVTSFQGLVECLQPY